MNEGTKKVGIITVCSLILIAMVVALTIGTREEEETPEVASSQKAVSTICSTTDYQTTCVDALKDGNTTDPKELIELAFQATIRYINQAAEKSVLIREVESDPRAESALESCHELSDRATNDLQRSFAKFSEFNVISVDDILLEMKIWLSGAITHQETCLDGFEEVPGGSGEKMRKALNVSMQMTSNALAMVSELATFLEGMGIGGFQNRRLLTGQVVVGHGGGGSLLLPEWTSFDVRRHLAAAAVSPDVVVAKDGSGKYRTINEAIKDVPKHNNKTFVVYIKEGVYEEKVWINSSLTHVMIVGDGPTKTRITGSLNFIDGTGTYRTATVAVQADDFIARDIGFENSAGAAKHQAVALRVSADRAIFYNCHMDGYQDTLYVHTYRQFYRDCVISGTIDFVFGDAAAVFQGCTLLVRKPMENQQNIVTAQGRKDVRQPTGLVIQNCTFKADPDYYPFRQKLKSYLARPWKQYSRTIIMESFIDDLIQPQGWLPWNETFALDTLFYTEFNNRGPGAPKAQRLKWAGVKELPSNRIQRFTAAEFLDGNRWIPQTRVPYDVGFVFPVPKEDPNVKYSAVVPEENKDLGGGVDKSSFVFKTNFSSSTTPASPPPPVPVAAPHEVGIPVDVLPIAAPPNSESPVGGPTAGESSDLGAAPSISPQSTAGKSSDLGASSSSPSISPQSTAGESEDLGVSSSPAISPQSEYGLGVIADSPDQSLVAPTTSPVGSPRSSEGNVVTPPAASPGGTEAAAAAPAPESVEIC